MKSKILTALIISGVVASTTFAYSGDCSNQSKEAMMYKKSMQHKNMMYHSGKYKDKMSCANSYKSKKHRDHFAKMFKRLDLSKKQRFEISILRDEMKLDLKKLRGFGYRNKIATYVKDSGFDAASYKKDMNSMSTKRVDIMANYMEKMFKVLTKEQITMFKKGLKR